MTNRTPFVKIPLTRGKVALVSPEDAERVLRHKWHAIPRVRSGYLSWKARTGLQIDGRTVGVYLHRFILGLGPGDPDVDHKNGNDLDCRRGNMREATPGQNSSNQRRKRTATAPYRGISRWKKRWRAQLDSNGKRYCLGLYATPEEAARAYDEAARQIHGEFACVNFPREGERRAG